MSKQINQQQSIVIIGGCGFVGLSLCKAFTAEGFRVIVIDISPCPEDVQKLVIYHQKGATNEDEIFNIVCGYHPVAMIVLASVGMSGSPMINPHCRVINVGIAKTAVSCCLKANIPNIIYTSTYNVVYGGKPIVNGNESNPYFPLDDHTDHYSPSKAIAEKYVLSQNGNKLANGKKLSCCAIRPAAIYGEGEQRHFPRLIKHIDSGLFMFRIGRAIVDWVHVDNLTVAYSKLVQKLLQLQEEYTDAPAGNAYFISDGTPIDNFEFLKDLCEARDCQFPENNVLPTSLFLALGYILENVYFISKFFGCPVEPFLTRGEVYKVGVTHYFDISKSSTDFGYKPGFGTSVGSKRIAEYYKIKSKRDNASFFRFADWYWWFLCVGGMTLTMTIAYELVMVESSEPNLKLLSLGCDYCKYFWIVYGALDRLALFLFRSRRGVRVVFWLATLAHVTEAFVAMNTALRIGCQLPVTILWGIQTLFLGFPSLGMLQKREALTEALLKSD